MYKLSDIALVFGVGFILFMGLLVVPPDDTITLFLCAFAFTTYGWLLHTTYSKRQK